VVGGVAVHTGDVVVGDRDGVVVIAAAKLDEVRAAGAARADKETGFFEELRDGKTTVELLGLDTSRIERPSVDRE
jgi:4-hydroxy-4-methyl-2-oxoglutarate aldolase